MRLFSCSRLKVDRGAGTILAIGAAATMVSAILGAVWVTRVVTEQARLQAVADTVAIAASDVRQGLISGFTCEVAEQLTTQNMATLQKCFIVGNSASIYVVSNRLGIVLKANARAEPNLELANKGEPLGIKAEVSNR